MTTGPAMRHADVPAYPVLLENWRMPLAYP
jgi:hypothetical protein